MQSLNVNPLAPSGYAAVYTANPKFKIRRDLSLLHSRQSADQPFSDALNMLRSYADTESPDAGSCYHAKILKSGLQNDVFISNSLLNVYCKCGRIWDAENVFDRMPHRTVVSWASMITGYCRENLAGEAVLLFCSMLEFVQPNEFALAAVLQACARTGARNLVELIHGYAVKSGLISDDFLQNALIDAYAKLGVLPAAEGLLQSLRCPDVVSWTSLITGCVNNGNVARAFVLFSTMQESGILPNEITLLTILRNCSETGDSKIMQWAHGLVLKGNWCASGLVRNCLIEMYSTNGYFQEAMALFCHFCFSGESLFPSPETVANLLHGCGNMRSVKLGEEMHGYVIKHGFLPSTVAENSLMNMYGENGFISSSLRLFRNMVERDVVSWNTVMKCLVKNDQPENALSLLGEIHRSGPQESVFIDFVTVLTSLEACSNLASLLHGQAIHGYTMKSGLINDILVQNALIDLYGKTAMVDLAEKIFKEMPERDIGSWNSIIAAFGINGKGTSCLNIFSDLDKSGTDLAPNAITFVNLLSSCAHSGLLEEGLEIFNSMKKHYGVQPSTEHFACMVDLLGRAGRLEEAETFIKTMPIEPGPDVWGALLNSSVLFGDVSKAAKAAETLAVLQPTGSTWRVALSNAYAAVGKWEDVAKIRAELRGSKELKKEGGWSTVSINGHEFSFLAADTKHPNSELIYETVIGLTNHMQNTALSSYAIAINS